MKGLGAFQNTVLVVVPKAVVSRCSSKQVFVLKNFAIHRKTPVLELLSHPFLIKLIKKRLATLQKENPTQAFSKAKFSGTHFFREHLR